MGCFAQECGPDTSFTQSLNSEGQTWNWSWNILCVYYPGGNINSPNAFRSNVGAPMGMPSDDPTANLNDATCS